MSEAVAAAPADPGATIRGNSYRVPLVFAALIGVPVSFAPWCFQDLVDRVQQEVVQKPAPVRRHPAPATPDSGGSAGALASSG